MRFECKAYNTCTLTKTNNMLFYLIKIIDMDANWFNDLFEREYENVMNNVV